MQPRPMALDLEALLPSVRFCIFTFLCRSTGDPVRLPVRTRSAVE